MLLDFGLSSQDFRDGYLYKQPKLFKGAVKNLDISWTEINEIYQRANPIDELFRLRKGEVVPVSEYVESFDDIGRTRYRFIKPAIYHHMKNGATIVYNRINNEPFVDNLAKQVAQFANAPTVTSGYLAFGSDASFKSHWDTRDVYAIQLIGKKHWSLYKPNFENPLYMQQAKDMDIEEPTIPDMEVVLEAGDVLYIPRGWWHNPVPMDCETFHLAVGTFAPTGYDYIEWLMKKFPNISSIRHNLDDWQYDLHNLNATATAITDMINDRENYDKFMQEYFANYRIDSAFNMQIFGNKNANDISLDALITLNEIDCRTIDKGYLIANGTKINIDESSRQLLNLISVKYQIKLSDIIHQLNDVDEDKIKQLIYHLAELDIVEVNDSDEKAL
ncbi:JmjC domain-containing protein [Moraxella sp. ZY210820]|uniref:JmjC domain-containing protein n=1 Tax=unclassified Moraxella TaxID=2685852 RepID=UPI00273082A6|nr:cupin domain-containing protein [Moraxella sp. ZY210820]WLF84192.1 cupin-like domain-containing protein [Moraxella sp. ZY210820]